MKFLKQYWLLVRPRDWIKSGFVFMGILFANAWRQPQLLRQVVLAAVAFSLIASGVYVFNDFLDRDQDLNHPRKKHRPLAARTISVAAAIWLVLLLWASGFTLAFLVSSRVVVILAENLSGYHYAVRPDR